MKLLVVIYVDKWVCGCVWKLAYRTCSKISSLKEDIISFYYQIVILIMAALGIASECVRKLRSIYFSANVIYNCWFHLLWSNMYCYSFPANMSVINIFAENQQTWCTIVLTLNKAWIYHLSDPFFFWMFSWQTNQYNIIVNRYVNTKIIHAWCSLMSFFFFFSFIFWKAFYDELYALYSAWWMEAFFSYAHLNLIVRLYIL